MAVICVRDADDDGCLMVLITMSMAATMHHQAPVLIQREEVGVRHSMMGVPAQFYRPG